MDFVSVTSLSLCQRRSIYNKFFQCLFQEVLIFQTSFLKALVRSRIMGFLLSVFRQTLFLDAIASFEKSTGPKTPSSLQVRDHFSLVIFKNFSLFLLSQSFWHTFTCILTSLPYVVFVDLFKVQEGVL